MLPSGPHSGYPRLSLEVPADSQGEDRGYWKLHGISSEIYSTGYIYTIEFTNMMQINCFSIKQNCNIIVRQII